MLERAVLYWNNVMDASTPSQNSKPRSSIRERHAELTRTAILDAARRLFAAEGYAATAVRPIAEEAGVAVQTLYTTFGSKQGLLLALVDTVRDQAAAPELGARMGRSDDPREIVAVAAKIRRQILERCGDIVVTFREGAAGDAQVAAAYGEGKRREREGIARACGRLEALGALKPGLTVERAVDQVAALFAAELYEVLTGPASGWSPDEYESWLADRLADVLLA